MPLNLIRRLLSEYMCVCVCAMVLIVFYRTLNETQTLSSRVCVSVCVCVFVCVLTCWWYRTLNAT